MTDAAATPSTAHHPHANLALETLPSAPLLLAPPPAMQHPPLLPTPYRPMQPHLLPTEPPPLHSVPTTYNSQHLPAPPADPHRHHAMGASSSRSTLPPQSEPNIVEMDTIDNFSERWHRDPLPPHVVGRLSAIRVEALRGTPEPENEGELSDESSPAYQPSTALPTSSSSRPAPRLLDATPPRRPDHSATPTGPPTLPHSATSTGSPALPQSATPTGPIYFLRTQDARE